jgi:hypothetical protein
VATVSYETQFSYWRSGLEAEQGDQSAALAYLAEVIRNNHESGNIGMLHNPLAIAAVILGRLGRYEPAATIAGFATINPMSTVTLPELRALRTHLREALGDLTFESLARTGETMAIATMVTYAYAQIDRTRTELTG